MVRNLSFLFILIFTIVLSNENHILNEFDRLEEVEYRLHNNVRDEVAYINASSFSEWTYFSFEAHDVVTIDNPESSLEWDLAFRRNHIKTNSGLSGSGQGGGYVNSEEKPFLKIKNKTYYKTGDNFIKKNGNYFFKGRLKDYIKVSGYRVNIQELENKLYNQLNFEGYFKLVNNSLHLFLNKNSAIS